MKKHIYYVFLLLFTASSLLTSCSKVTPKNQPSIASSLSDDEAFRNTLDAAAEMALTLNVESLNNEANIAELQIIAAKIQNGTATASEYEKVRAITGVSYEQFIGSVQKFALTLKVLNDKHPELSKMNQAELSKTITDAINANPALQSFVANPAATTMRVAACPLRDICNLAVVLVKVFAGDTICVAISVSTIPVIGGILCQLVLTLGVGILTGICNALPC